MPSVSQDGDADQQTASSVPLSIHDFVKRRWGGVGKYLWDARMGVGRHRRSVKSIKAVKASMCNGQLLTRVEYHQVKEPLLVFHFIHGHNVEEMGSFLEFVTNSLRSGEQLTDKRLSVLFKLYVEGIWTLNGWHKAGIILPDFYPDSDSDDDSNSGKRPAIGSPGTPSAKRPTRA